MKKIIEDMSKNPFASVAGMGLAATAVAMSVVCAVFVPYGHPWPSLGWAVLACAGALWVFRGSILLAPQALPMSDVIHDVEAESPRAPGAAAGSSASTRVDS